MRTLTIVTPRTSPPPLAELLQLEAEDKHPRASLFAQVLNADLLDEQFLLSIPKWRKIIYGFLPIWFRQVLEAFLRRDEYDAVISWAEHLAIGFAALLKFTGTKIPHIALMYSISKSKKARLLRYVHSHIDRLILWTSSQREFAIGKLDIPTHKVMKAQYLVDQKFYRPMGYATDMICSAGREMRDYGTLIRALEGTNIRCHIAAYSVPGKKDSWIKGVEEVGTLPPNVTIGPMKDLADLRELYGRSRFIVVPLLENETDSGTTVILEAMAMGKAVVCSRTAGQRDNIKDGESGILVRVGDVIALRNAILHLWSSPEIAEDMGRAGRRIVEEGHTLDGFVKNVKDIVEHVIGQHRPQQVEGRPQSPEARTSNVLTNSD